MSETKNETNALELLRRAFPHCPAALQADIRSLLSDRARIPLTKRQKECLEAIKFLRDAHDGVMPSMEEIGAAMGVSKVSAWECFVHLERKGFVARDGHRARSIVII